MALTSPPFKSPNDVVEDMRGLHPRPPLALRPQQVFLRHHFENGTHILGHPAMHQHETLLKLIAGFRRHFVASKDLMVGKQAAAADAEFRIAFLGQDAVNELDARPYAAGILPTAARAAQPFAQDSARRHQAPVVLFEAPGKRVNLVVARMHTATSEARRLVETAKREPLGMSFTLLTISMPWPARPVRRASRSPRG